MKSFSIFLSITVFTVLISCGDDAPSGPESETEFDFSGDLIAFRSDRGGSDDIWLMTPDGSELINITNNPATDSDPSWSPDGSRIAFVSTRTGNADLFVMNADGTGIVQVTDNQGSIRFPKWSPDGNLIAFSSSVNGQRDLYVIPDPAKNKKDIPDALAQCDGLVQLTNHPKTDNEPVWSPDGSSIYFYSSRDGIGGVWEMDFGCDGEGNPVKLTVEFVFACAPGLGFSLVGGQAKLSFVGEQNEQFDIWVASLGSSKSGSPKLEFEDLSNSYPIISADLINPINITNDPEKDWASSWTDDGRLIFETERNGNWDIYSIQENGENMIQLTDHAADDRYPVWRPQN